jgi:hypothetical protein
MSVKTLLSRVAHAVLHVFTASNLTAAMKFVADVSPIVAEDLMKASALLPSSFSSLEQLAEVAIKLVKDAKGITISKSLAIHLAQAVLTANWPEIVVEAETLLGVE